MGHWTGMLRHGHKELQTHPALTSLSGPGAPLADTALLTALALREQKYSICATFCCHPFQVPGLHSSSELTGNSCKANCSTRLNSQLV